MDQKWIYNIRACVRVFSELGLLNVNSSRLGDIKWNKRTGKDNHIKIMKIHFVGWHFDRRHLFYAFDHWMLDTFIAGIGEYVIKELIISTANLRFFFFHFVHCSLVTFNCIIIIVIMVSFGFTLRKSRCAQKHFELSDKSN